MTDELPDLFDSKTGKPLVPVQWGVRTPDGRVFKLWDLPIKDTTALAVDFGRGWASIVENPVSGDGGLMLAVYRMVCRHLEQEPVDNLTTRDIYDVFQVLPDDKPTIYEGGLPKAEDETPTV